MNMVFHIHIHCRLDICKDTGRHFFYDGFQHVYDMPKDIPEEHRGFVKMSGELFRIYTGLVTDDLSTSVDNFVDKYPEWSDILESCHFEEFASFWNEDKHNNFYAALKWFSQQKICYMISWYD